MSTSLSLAGKFGVNSEPSETGLYPGPVFFLVFFGSDFMNTSLSLAGNSFIVQELCESRGGRPGLSVLTSLLASVDVKIY